ncbi:antibiotic biosynthesis monooxygenase [Kitasatospora sp. GP82]|uniref:putative quinol monooxygenase n=1 Tax=Kitasatospora sp. GP82 TaxID=3035089 RepID=UPI0024732C89|nr:antibiotic biosynthesis monooxygenase [Kitasatospora sp. GP82]MDH6126515.1 quinol monooxygenase YgiN [Kitasatospora sp. GP82]
MAIVIAHVHPEPGRLQEVLDAYRETVPLIHQEHGCELFAVQTDGESVLIVERWTTPEHLQAHAHGRVYARIRELIDGALERPSDVWRLENIPLGMPTKGTIQ